MEDALLELLQQLLIAPKNLEMNNWMGMGHQNVLLCNGRKTQISYYIKDNPNKIKEKIFFTISLARYR